MAELAIDISKTAVEALVNKINSAIKEEEEQWQTLKHDLVFITDEFEMMQSFLNSADGELVKTNMVRTWVRQVRNLSYDLEDCIEFILHLDTNKRCGKEGVALPVDEAVTEMKQLKARVEDVSQRNIRYRFVSDSACLTLTQEKLVYGSAIGAPGFDILAEARDTVARRTGVVDLIKLITEESNDLRVISLWGTGDDLGITTIIRNIFTQTTLAKNLLVEMHALSWILQKLRKQQRDALSWTETSAGELVKEFLRQIDKHRYLIILEDLSTVVQWDAIRPYLRGGNNRSRVLVSTRAPP
uniref:Rx N-terminal domain-containing protein n=1 Tax=Oryza barthii TaxID=65489 RepID=A0A0D3HM11_9ORYZ